MKKQPESVFTPRSAEVNSRMYVDRPEHETRLRSALVGTQHILIHGESGSGKSWLYKRVLAADKIPYEVVNLANASSFGSLRQAFKDITQREGPSQQVSKTITKQARLNTGLAAADLGQQDTFAIGQLEPLELCYENLAKRAKNKRSVLVLDNLETIHSSQSLMAELGNIIILLDDQRYAKYNVKFIIVGVPSGIREYYRKMPNRQTVANRLIEIPELARLTNAQCRDLIIRGFQSELGYNFSDAAISNITNHAEHVTDGVPQRLHEWCLELAYLLGNGPSKLDSGLLEMTDWEFLSMGLWDDYETILYLMNADNPKIGRRNQVIYSLGTIRKDRFTTTEIESEVRKQFPKTTRGKNINVSAIMGELSQADTPIIRRVHKGDAFAFSDPRYRMCIRAMLRKDSNTEKVRPINLGSI